MKKKILLFVGAVLVGGILGYFLGILLAEMLPRTEELSIMITVQMLGLLLLCLWLHIILHETGHLILGLLTGYRFVSFRIGSLMLLYQNGKLQVKKFRLAGTVGQCLLGPPDLKKKEIPFAWYNTGGVIFNIVTAGLAWIGVYYLPQNTWLKSFSLMFGVVGLLTAVLNGVPVKSGMVVNDGYNVWMLKKDEGARQAFWQQMKVAEQQALGIRLKDMPKEWFVWPKAEKLNNIFYSTAAVFCLNRLVDEQQWEEFEKQYNILMKTEHKNIIPIYQYWLEGDALCCLLLRGERGVEPSTGLKNLWKSMKDNPGILRQKIAFEKLERRDEAATNILRQQFEKACAYYPYPGDVVSEREILMNIMDVGETE